VAEPARRAPAPVASRGTPGDNAAIGDQILDREEQLLPVARSRDDMRTVHEIQNFSERGREGERHHALKIGPSSRLAEPRQSQTS